MTQGDQMAGGIPGWCSANPLRRTRPRLTACGAQRSLVDSQPEAAVTREHLRRWDDADFRGGEMRVRQITAGGTVPSLCGAIRCCSGS
jgi:hypothetical protein